MKSLPTGKERGRQKESGDSLSSAWGWAFSGRGNNSPREIPVSLATAPLVAGASETVAVLD